MRRNKQTLMSFRERLSAAIALTLLLVVYQQTLRENPQSFSRTINNVFPSISSSAIFP